MRYQQAMRGFNEDLRMDSEDPSQLIPQNSGYPTAQIGY